MPSVPLSVVTGGPDPRRTNGRRDRNTAGVRWEMGVIGGEDARALVSDPQPIRGRVGSDAAR
jgi:hypothetical protein